MVERIILAIIGTGIVIDGIGSILLQEQQPVWWQVERATRMIAGLIVWFRVLVVLAHRP